MKREFLIEEIMLDGVSGEVRGSLELDILTGLIDRVDCDTFSFRVDETDAPALLDASERNLAVQMVERLLEGQTDLTAQSGPLVASAQAIPVTGLVSDPDATRPAEAAASRQILAELLESAGRRNDGQQKRRAQ